MSDEKLHKVFVYGSLRPTKDLVNKLGMMATGEQVHVQGFLYELSWFPGIKLDTYGMSVLCDILLVNDEELERLDYYEGYYEKHPNESLFVRKEINVNGHDGFIYEYNGQPRADQKLMTGDWLQHQMEEMSC